MDRASILSTVAHFPNDALADDSSALVGLRDRLIALGYTCERIEQKLRLSSIMRFNRVSHDFTMVRLWDRYFLDHLTPLDILIRVFFLGLPEADRVVSELFHPPEMSLLRRAGLLADDESGCLTSPVTLWPCSSLLIATDWIAEWCPEDESSPAVRRVMSLGWDSYSLAHAVPSAIEGPALDLCTGSGVIALQMASRGHEVVGVDINPRAVNFATFNALFNGLPRARFFCGDLFDFAHEHPSLPWAFISANPPFVPAPSTEQLLYRSGGPSGEDVLSRIVAGCVEHLAPRGICQIVTELVDTQVERYEDKVSRWLGGSRDFAGAVLFQGAPWTPMTHAARYSHEGGVPCPRHGHIAAFDWVDTFNRVHLKSIDFGFILLHRSPGHGSPIARWRHTFVPSSSGVTVDLPRRVLAALARLSEGAANDPTRLRLQNVEYGALSASTDTDTTSLSVSTARLMSAMGRASYTLTEIATLVGHESDAHARSVIARLMSQLLVAGILIEVET
jgi:carbamoyltransferase